MAEFEQEKQEGRMSEGLQLLGEAGQILERMRAAAIAQSASELEQLYAVDAVHEFPFNRPGVPSRLGGRTSSTTGSFIPPNLVVLTGAGGEIQRFRDFVNILAALEAMGHEL
jgi:hypothetical protein